MHWDQRTERTVERLGAAAAAAARITSSVTGGFGRVKQFGGGYLYRSDTCEQTKGTDCWTVDFLDV